MELTLKREEKAKKKKGLAGVGAIIIAILLKIKGLLILLFTKLKFLGFVFKFTKFAPTTISMLLTIWIYAKAFGIWFAVGLVGILFAHEIGHCIAAKLLGIEVSTPLFIPFVGAFIRMKEEPKDAVVEAKIAYGGPLLGTIVSLVPLIYYAMTGSKLAVSLAYTGFFLNLFNLIPYGALDGGRIVNAISPKMWILGLLPMAYFVFTTSNPILLLIFIFGLLKAYDVRKNKNEIYYDVSSYTKMAFTFFYFGLIGALFVGLLSTMSILHHI